MFDPAWYKKQSLYGMSPLRAAARVVSKQNEAEQTQLKQFENQGAPYALYRDNNQNSMDRLTDTQRSQITKQIKKHGKSEDRGLPLILKDKYGVLNLGQTITDMNIIESSKDGLIRLCNVYGIPPELFGVGKTIYNNVKEAKKSAWTHCIQPNLTEIANAFNEITINSYTDYYNAGLYWDFDYSQVEELQQEMKDKVDWMSKARWTPNEIRQATGKEPIDDELMNQPIFTTNEMFLSDLGSIDGEKNFIDYEK
jgi:HK97 family phage portal protein